MMIEDEYICIKNLVIMSDSECGYHVYAKHGYKDISVDFNTDSEDLIMILNFIFDFLLLLSVTGLATTGKKGTKLWKKLLNRTHMYCRKMKNLDL